MRARIFLVAASCLLSLVTGLVRSRGGASPGAGERRPPLIGLSLDTLKEERWQHDRDLFVARARELGADVLVQAANSDDTRQIQDVEALISRRVDVLVVVPHNGQAMAKAVALAHEAGIPVIAYDRLIPKAGVDLYISFDAVTVGAQQARFLVEQFKGKGPRRIVRVHGAKTDNNALLGKKGQDGVLDPLIRRGQIVVAHEDWAENWKPESAKKIVQAALTRAGRFDAVLAANDGTAGGAAQALAEEGLTGKVLVTGMDAELAACQRVVHGTQSMTIYKPLKLLAHAAADAAVKLAQRRPVVAKAEVDDGQAPVPSILMDVVTVTRDNISATVVRDGFHALEDVYRGVPLSQRPR
ncbi:MAG: substrate-binding domain-containing protein [Elusimicrobia bacterium]|nr:substrate-binding domain-containing protein [Elusimicrobiota bacterium]